MLNILNKLVKSTIHLIPKYVIKIFANQYVAGITTADALKTVRKLNNEGFEVTLDILGEHTENKKNADSITNQYREILNQINLKKLKCNISIKPSHIGSDISDKILMNNFKKLHNTAIENKNFIRIDMESSSLTDITLNTYAKIYTEKNNIGVVLQAYLYRTEKDLMQLKPNSNIRLCKGIYNENHDIAIKDPKKINDNYLKLLKMAFERNIYVGIATHDINLIKASIIMIKEMNIDKDYEGMDAGPKSLLKFKEVVLNSKTILWNGPLGVFEFSNFSKGTKELGKYISESTQNGAFSLVGGGDSVAAVKSFKMQKNMSYVSTGGGAMLESLEGKNLPGINALLK